MAKKLKLAFCMGGGVSLGAFSGGALAEILRQVIYPEVSRVLDGKEPKYKTIEVDAFMGSSAGSVTLVLMMRALAYSLPDEANENGEVWENAKDDLKRVFGGDAYDQLNSDGNTGGKRLWKQLLGVARVDYIQRKVWIEGLSIDSLLPDEPREASAGLLDGAHLGELAASLAGFKTKADGSSEWATERKTSDRTLLADQVVFGCTLTPLHPLESPQAKNYQPDGDAIRQFGPVKDRFFNPGMRNWITKPSSRDARFFRVCFEGDSAMGMTGNWVLVNDSGDQDWGDEKNRTRVGHPAAWKEMFTTAVGSGAFPGAFQPVLLRRHRKEYGLRLPPALDGNGERFVELPFVDGGTFNNQPLEETVRICAKLDENQNGVSDRMIFHVDSSISSKEPVRRFGHQFLIEGKFSRKTIHETPRRRPPAREEVRSNEWSPTFDLIRGSLFSIAGEFFGQKEDTTKTPVFEDDLAQDLPDWVGRVCSIVPVDAELQRIDLRGSGLSGFGGFFDGAYRTSDYLQGKDSVYEIFQKFSAADDNSGCSLKNIGWKDACGKFRPIHLPEDRLRADQDPDRKAIKVVSEKLAVRIDEIIDDGIELIFLDPLLRKFGKKKLLDFIVRSVLNEEASPFQSILLAFPGTGWELTTEGKKTVDTEEYRDAKNKIFSLFRLKVLVEDDDLDGIEPALFDGKILEHDAEDGRRNGILLASRRSASIELNPIPDGLREAILTSLRHGSPGILCVPDADHGKHEWRLFQPSNEIEFGFNKQS